MKIIWCMIPEIWSTTDRIFFSFWTIFCPFTPPTPSDNPENQNFEKMKIAPGDIIILHKCTINDNHMIYGSWDIKCNRQLFLSSLVIFYPFTPLKPKKRKYQKIEKKQNTCRYHVPKTMIIGYTVAEIWCVPDVIIFHFDLFFTLSPP